MHSPPADRSTVAQQAEATVASVPSRIACELLSLIGSNTMPGQPGQPTPTSLGQGVCVLGATCHLHFWKNDRGLLCATVVTRDGTDTE